MKTSLAKNTRAGNQTSVKNDSTFVKCALEEYYARLCRGMEVSRWLHEMGKPTIAMMRGAAAGAGLSMVLACDMRFAAEGTKLTTAFVNVGFSGDYGGSYFLTHLVGTAKARELYYSGEVILADEALRLGMVNRVYADQDLEAETKAFAAKLAAGPRIAIGYMKKNMNAAEQGTPLAACFDQEALHHSRCGLTEDHKEATRAFVEKRKPVFRSR